MFGLEPWHIVLLLAVVLVIFGPKRLPEIGKNLGESIREFRKATTEFGDSVKSGAASPSESGPLPTAGIAATTVTPVPAPTAVPVQAPPVSQPVAVPGAVAVAPSAAQPAPSVDAGTPGPSAGTAG